MATSTQGSRQRVRERELVAATRKLFDERGMQDAPIEQIARSVGIARGLIYRQFSSKEELYVLTVTDYLAELDGRLAAATEAGATPTDQLEACTRAFAAFCQQYPAFLDSCVALMRRPAEELRGIVSGSVWLRLGQGMASCVGHLTEVLRSGREGGGFDLAGDPDLIANTLWTQMLGVMHLARLGAGIRQLGPGIPDLFAIDPDRLVDTCVAHAMAAVGVSEGRSG